MRTHKTFKETRMEKLEDAIKFARQLVAQGSEKMDASIEASMQYGLSVAETKFVLKNLCK